MKLKNNLKKVEKTSRYSVYDIRLDIEQNCIKSGTRNLLTIDYRVACTSDTSLSEFISKIKSEPIKAYSDQFFSDISISSVIVITKVDPAEYTISKIVDSSALFILTCHEKFRSNRLIKFNCDLIGYHPNIR